MSFCVIDTLVHIQIITQVLIGINNFAKCQQQGHIILGFSHNRPKALAQFDPKSNVYTIIKRGRQIKIYIGSGCRVGLYSNKQISYQGQPILGHCKVQ